MPDRREMLYVTAALMVPTWARAASSSAGLTRVLAGFAERFLEQSPQSLTGTGLDVGPNAGARAKLDDRSPAGMRRFCAQFAQLQQELARFNPDDFKWAD
jgi:uncharacterized protein (DUF885 family)